MPNRSDLTLALGNLASQDGVGRLKAVHQVGEVLRQELEAAVFTAELAQVRQARSAGKSWREIGVAIGVSHAQARRRYVDHL
jgi:hypothetical protein